MRYMFPFLQDCIYLNTAYTGLLSEPLVEWRKQDDKNFQEHGDLYKRINEKDYFDEAKTELAQFIGTKEDNCFITSNFSFAFQTFLFSLPRNSNFLILEEEYPSLVEIVSDHGFEFKQIQISSNIEEKIWDELHKNQYKVFALSIIQYASGLLFDLDWLKKIKKAFPNLLILVDGTQFVGAEKFNFSLCPIDAIFGSTYKWLLAGYGTGFLAVKDEVITQLNLDKNKFSKSFDRGQLSVKALGSLTFSIRQIQKANFDELMDYKSNLARKLFEGLKKRQLIEPYIAERKKHSSIFNIQISTNAFQYLLSNNVRCIPRGKGVRISIHHYNTNEEIDVLFDLLDKYTEKKR